MFMNQQKDIHHKSIEKLPLQMQAIYKTRMQTIERRELDLTKYGF